MHMQTIMRQQYEVVVFSKNNSIAELEQFYSPWGSHGDFILALIIFFFELIKVFIEMTFENLSIDFVPSSAIMVLERGPKCRTQDKGVR